MLKVIGRYGISLDGGATWKESDNMLLTGYYSKGTYDPLKILVGGSLSPVSFSDTSIDELAFSDSKSGLSDTVSFSVEEDKFTSVGSQDFTLGTGHNFDISEVGLASGSYLVSRTLLANPISVRSNDLLKVRYSIEYEVSRSVIRSSIEYKGREIGLSIHFVNPNQWGSKYLGDPCQIETAAFGNGWYIDSDSYLQGGEVIGTGSLTGVKTALGPSKREKQASYVSGLPGAVGTYNQIIVCGKSAARSAALILIEFDEPIEKTADDFFGFSISIAQEHI